VTSPQKDSDAKLWQFAALSTLFVFGSAYLLAHHQAPPWKWKWDLFCVALAVGAVAGYVLISIKYGSEYGGRQSGNPAKARAAGLLAGSLVVILANAVPPLFGILTVTLGFSAAIGAAAREARERTKRRTIF
jgi:hypothetical protein